MQSLIRFFTQGFARARPAAKQDADADALRLIAEVDAALPARAAQLLAAEIPALASFEPDLERRLRLVDALHAAAERKLPAIEQEIEAAALPLPAALASAALAADNVLKSIAGEYQTIVARFSPHDPRGGPLPPQVQHATLQASRVLVRRQWLACRAGMAASATAWRRLHRLHRLARDGGFVSFNDGGGSIESYYLAAILLALADPARAPRADLVAMLATIRRLAPLARLIEARVSGGAAVNACGSSVNAAGLATERPLVVDPHNQQPVLGGGHTSAGDVAWRIDLEPVIGRLQLDIRLGERLREGDAHPLPLGAPLRVALRLLEVYRRQPLRRFTRQCMRPRVDVVTGLDRLWWALSGPNLSRRRAGLIAAPPQEDALEWAIVDESPDGFGLRLVQGQAPELAVGDIVGVGMRDVGRLHLCIVRRIGEDPRQRCRLGVQTLAPEAAALVVTGEDGERQEPVIRLSALPAHGGRPGLAVAAGRLRPGTPVRVVGGQPGEVLKVAAQVESNGRFDLLLLGR